MSKVRTYVLLGMLFSIPSGYFLYRLITETKPFLKERWIFYFLLFLLICGIGLPFYAMMNKWFFTAKRIRPETVLRETIGTALLLETILWFRIGRALNGMVLMVGIGGFVLIEILMRARENIAFRTGIDDEEEA